MPQRDTQMRQTTYHRTLELDLSRAVDSEDARTIPAALSSNIELKRWYGIEVLEHTEKAVDLARAQHNGLPLLFGHRHGELIGRIRDLTLDAGKLRGVLHFSRSARATEIWQDVRDGFLSDISIGYGIEKWREEKSDDGKPTRYVITRWQPHEASVVAVPADYTVGIGRAAEDIAFTDQLARALVHQAAARGIALPPAPPVMGTDLIAWRAYCATHGLDFDLAIRQIAGELPPTTTEDTTMPEPTTGGDNVTDFKTAIARGRATGIDEGMRAERARLSAINELFSLPGVQQSATMLALRDTAIEQGWTVERTQRAVLELRGAEPDAGAVGQPASDPARGISHERTPHVQSGVDQRDKFREGAELALAVRGGLYASFDGQGQTAQYREALAKARQGGYLGMSLRRLAEECLRIHGIDFRALADEEVVGRAFALRTAGHTTSDFTAILENVAHKSILVGWEEAPETWRGLARVGNLNDFRPASRPGLSNFSDLSEIAEDGEIPQGTFVDLKETITLREYAKKFRLTRRTIINDDLGAFTMVPRKMGRAAARTVGDVFWGMVINNPALAQDNTALFHSSHNNLQQNGDLPSVAQLNLAFAEMMLQTDPSGNGYVGGEPRYIAGPPALRGTILALLNSQKDPAEGTTTSFTAENIYYKALVPVIEPRLQAEAGGDTAWYLFKDPNLYDTFELGFLNGIQEPYMREEQEWDTRGVEFVVGIDVGGAPLDYRNVYKDPGT